MSLKHFITFILTLGVLAVFGQDKSSYRIVKTGGVADLTAYHQALQTKDLDAHRLINASRTIKFDSGVEIELYSAQYLETEFGRFRDHRFMNRMGNEPVYPWFWVLSPEGVIIDKRINAVTQ